MCHFEEFQENNLKMKPQKLDEHNQCDWSPDMNSLRKKQLKNQQGKQRQKYTIGVTILTDVLPLAC